MNHRNSLYQDAYWPRADGWLAGKAQLHTRGLLRVLGIPVTLGTISPSRCDLAPKAIREALAYFCTYDVEHQRDIRGISTEDLGDLPLADSQVADANDRIVGAVRSALSNAEALVVLGGDNSLTRPACIGMRGDLKKSGLLTFDAHLDLRHLDDGLVNGNPVRALLEDGLPGNQVVQIGIQSFANSAAYFEVAREAGISVMPLERVSNQGIEAAVQEGLGILDNRAESIYVDLDLDVLDRSYAPATAGSRPGGLYPREVRSAMYECGLHPKVRALDLVEVDPTRDINNITALTAAACLLSFASGLLGRLTPGASTTRSMTV